MDPSPLRVATGNLIGYGIVGSILDSAYTVLEEVDEHLADDLLIIMDTVMERFHEAERSILAMDGFHE
jgi:hypothetical protein